MLHALIESTGSSDSSALDGEEDDPTLLVTPPSPPSPDEKQEEQNQQQDKREEPYQDQSQNVDNGSLASFPVSEGTTPVSAAGHCKRRAPSSARSRRRVVFTQPTGDGKHQEGPTDLLNNPSFIFLQLYHSSAFNAAITDTPLLLPSSEVPAST